MKRLKIQLSCTIFQTKSFISFFLLIEILVTIAKCPLLFLFSLSFCFTSTQITADVDRAQWDEEAKEALPRSAVVMHGVRFPEAFWVSLIISGVKGGVR